MRNKFAKALPFLICLVPVVLLATNFTVKAGGGGNFTTINACTTQMSASGGDTCTVFAGTYTENPSINAGLASSYNVLTVNGSDVVTVNGQITVNSHTKAVGNCPALQGTQTTPTCGFFVQNASSPTTNCFTVAASATDWFIQGNNGYDCGGVSSPSTTSFGSILANTFSYPCSTSASPNVCTPLKIFGNHIIVENNDLSHFSDGSDGGGDHNVFRGNSFHDAHTSDISTNGDNHVDMIELSGNGASLFLFEGNQFPNCFVDGGVGAACHGGPLAQCGVGPCGPTILRFQVDYHIQGAATTADQGNWPNLKEYNNTWADMQNGGTGGFQTNNQTGEQSGANLNEIYYYVTNPTPSNQGHPYGYGASPGSSRFGNDLAWCPNEPSATCSANLFGFNTGAFSADPNNKIADPLFNSFASQDFHLQTGSPALNAGTNLTTVAAGDSGSGTSLVVNDANYFQDAWGFPAGTGLGQMEPDCVSVTSVLNHICIAAGGINYSTNTITLASSITRSPGDPVWLYSDSLRTVRLTGTAPALGAFAAAAPNPPPAGGFTTVSGTITDPSGIPYAYGTISAVLTPSVPGGYTLLGQPYSGTISLTALDGNGSFTVNVGDNTQITPSGSQWTFTVGTAGVIPPLGTGAQSFTVPISISGTSQSISTNLSAAAPALCATAACPLRGTYATNFKTHDDTQWAWDATYTALSNDLVLNNTFGTDPAFLPSDVCTPAIPVCKQIWCTGQPIVGGSGLSTSTTQLPAPNQWTTISQFISPFHIKTLANATTSNAGNGVCAWGTPDDTIGPNSPATLAANAAINACVPLFIPARNIYNTGPGSLLITHDFFNQDTARFCPRSAEGARGGAGVVGGGSASASYIILASIFTSNVNTCTHGQQSHVACILSVFDGQYFQNFVVWGLGESGTTGGPRSVNLMEVGRGATSGNGTIKDVFFQGFWGGDGSTKGLLFNGGNVAFRNVQYDGFGGTPCSFAGSMLQGWDSGYCGDSIGTAITIGGTARFHSMEAGPAGTANGCILNILSGGVVHDFGGVYSSFSQGTGQAGACVAGTMDAHGTTFDVTGSTNSFGVDVLSGGKFDYEDITALAPAAGSIAIQTVAGGSTQDLGGRSTISGTTTFSNAGIFIPNPNSIYPSDPSHPTVTGTGPCATITTQLGTIYTGSFKCTGATGAATITITPGTTALNGFRGAASDITTTANSVLPTGGATTTATFSAATITANDVITFSINPF